MNLTKFRSSRRTGLFDHAITEKGGHSLVEVRIGPMQPECRGRRLAHGCPDWSKRRFNPGGSPGAAILGVVPRKRWLVRDLEGRGITPTPLGRQEFRRRFGIDPLAIEWNIPAQQARGNPPSKTKTTHK